MCCGILGNKEFPKKQQKNGIYFPQSGDFYMYCHNSMHQCGLWEKKSLISVDDECTLCHPFVPLESDICSFCGYLLVNKHHDANYVSQVD